MASGSLYTKIYKGIKELAWLGLIEWNNTRMSGTQALGCSPIAEAWARGSFNIRPQKPDTIAKSLAIGNPADGYYALKTMKDTNGSSVAIPDNEVVDGIRLLAETEGIFAETAGGVVIGGLKRLVESGDVHPDEVVVAFITGAGLKTQEAVAPALKPALTIKPTIEAFEEAYSVRTPAVAGRAG
jgi:threonine synthase